MESEFPSGGFVNLSHEKVADNFAEEYAGFERVTPPPEIPDKAPREIPDVARKDLMWKLERYALGVFKYGKDWEWAVDLRRKFAAAKGRNLKDLEDIFPEFQAWTQNFTFRLEPYKNTRRICIYPKFRRVVISNAEITRRLARAIAVHMRGRKQACIDLTFLGIFQERTGLEPNAISHAWSQIFWIKGYRVRWNDRRTCFYVSHGLKAHPENPAGISSLREKDQKTSGYAGPDSSQSSGSLRSQPGEVGEGSACDVVAPEPNVRARDHPPRPPPPPGGDDQSLKPAGTPGEAAPPGAPRAPPCRSNFQGMAARLPWQVGERWIVPKRNDKKARWLAFEPLQNMHAESWGVEFGGQTVNFAREAIAAGFLDSEICAAYRRGLDASHASAMRDRADCGIVHVWKKRAPSQAVNLAWAILRADGRTDEERWVAIFARRPVPMKAEPRPEGALPRSPYRQYGAGFRVRAPAAEKPRRAAPVKTIIPVVGPVIELEGKFPETTPAAQRALESPTIEAYLKTRGMTLADMLRLSRAEQQKFVRAMHAWQKENL